jgi:hypothetical protein
MSTDIQGFATDRFNDMEQKLQPERAYYDRYKPTIDWLNKWSIESSNSNQFSAGTVDCLSINE